jgi:sec-independent protein translocase protein TatC
MTLNPTMKVDGRMLLTEHLRELRDRLVICAIAVGLAFIPTYTYSEHLYDFIKRPLMPALPKGQEFMAFTGVVEPFFTFLKVGLLAAVVLASPVLLYQAWAFIVPALKQQEKKWMAPVVFASVVLFFTGVVFAHQVVFPVGFKYLLSFASEELRPVLSIASYFSLATKLLLAFGVVFQLPLFILVFARLGMVDSAMLVRYWKYALLAAVSIGALLTPPDVFSQLLMGGPIMVLYGVGIIVAHVFGKKKEEEEEEEEAALDKNPPDPPATSPPQSG